VDELIEDIKTAFENGAPQYTLGAKKLSSVFGSVSDEDVEVVAGLFALSNGWDALFKSGMIIFRRSIDNQ
jgi:hypothetical protein